MFSKRIWLVLNLRGGLFFLGVSSASCARKETSKYMKAGHQSGSFRFALAENAEAARRARIIYRMSYHLAF
jgi:hypothetical protein